MLSWRLEVKAPVASRSSALWKVLLSVAGLSWTQQVNQLGIENPLTLYNKQLVLSEIIIFLIPDCWPQHWFSRLLSLLIILPSKPNSLHSNMNSRWQECNTIPHSITQTMNLTMATITLQFPNHNSWTCPTLAMLPPLSTSMAYHARCLSHWVSNSELISLLLPHHSPSLKSFLCLWALLSPTTGSSSTVGEQGQVTNRTPHSPVFGVPRYGLHLPAFACDKWMVFTQTGSYITGIHRCYRWCLNALPQASLTGPTWCTRYSQNCLIAWYLTA